jgi:ribosomal protein S18 acetylase RimI-like enzyme/RimJ/RimL family protein N-acetyltransferase
MNSLAVRVRPIGWRDMLAVTRMTFDNMIGVDRYFTRMVRTVPGRWAAFATLPFYLRYSGRGFKVLVNGSIAACGFLHLRRLSGYLFNISVNRPYRRQGLGRRLVTHLEHVITENGQGWAALQVDRGNEPAEQLYRQLGYRGYHPHFLRREGQPLIGTAVTAGLTIEPMSQYPGKELFKHFQEVERLNGDSWAAAVVGEYDSYSSRQGTFWRCRRDEREIGCAQVIDRNGHALIRLALDPEHWGNLTTGGLAQELMAALPGDLAYVDLNLESSAHHRAAAQLLNDLGFHERQRSRTLMLKTLLDGALHAGDKSLDQP